MADTCTRVRDLPPFKYQSTPQGMVEGLPFQIETSQRNVEDYLARMRREIAADIQCLCDLVTDLEARVTALETP